MKNVFKVHCVGSIEVVSDDKEDALKQAQETIKHAGLDFRTVGVIDSGEYVDSYRE